MDFSGVMVIYFEIPLFFYSPCTYLLLVTVGKGRAAMHVSAPVHWGKVFHPASGCVVGHSRIACTTSCYDKAVSKIDGAMLTKNIICYLDIKYIYHMVNRL